MSEDRRASIDASADLATPLVAPIRAVDFVQAHARATDPDTSHEAALSKVDEFARDLVLVLATLADNPDGLTSEQISDRIRLSHWAVTKRVSDGKNAGLIVDTCLRRRNRSNRRAAIWRLADPTNPGLL